MPVPLPTSESAASGGFGNRVGVLLVPLPLAEADIARRLDRIAAVTREEKVRAPAGRVSYCHEHHAAGTPGVPAAPRRRLVSIFVTNIPGPQAALRVGGARLIHAYPAAPMAGNVTLGIGVLSYAGELGVGLIADADAWPDLPVFVDAARESFEALTGAA